MQTDEGASRHWHLLMAAYSLVRLDPESSALGTVRSKASSLRDLLGEKRCIEVGSIDRDIHIDDFEHLHIDCCLDVDFALFDFLLCLIDSNYRMVRAQIE